MTGAIGQAAHHGCHECNAEIILVVTPPSCEMPLTAGDCRLYNYAMPFRAPGLSSQAFKKSGKAPPPEETFEEANYLRSLGEKQRPVTVKLMDGDTVKGWIEYYDKNMIRLTREGAPNLFIFKHEVMYIAEDAGGAPQRRPRS